MDEGHLVPLTGSESKHPILMIKYSVMLSQYVQKPNQYIRYTQTYTIDQYG